MILILTCKNTGTEKIEETLDNLEINFTKGFTEKAILESKSIIIPDCADPVLAVRQLHLYSLVTALRILKKPLLAIGNGTVLLSEKMGEKGKGIGIFPFGMEESLEPEKSEETARTTNFTSSEAPFPEDNGEKSFVYMNDYEIPENPYTTSVYEKEGRTVPASVAYNNYIGLIFRPELSGEPGRKLLNSFASLR